jgi:hypothetical protein
MIVQVVVDLRDVEIAVVIAVAVVIVVQQVVAVVVEVAVNQTIFRRRPVKSKDSIYQQCYNLKEQSTGKHRKAVFVKWPSAVLPLLSVHSD